MNLIIVLVDTLRADHLHYHGYPRDTSPRIDQFAANSQVFLSHQASSSRTGPSVASIFTGLFPRSHGVINPLTSFDAKGVLNKDQTTMAEILSAQGYECFGYTANLNASGRFGFAQGFREYQLLITGSATDIRRRAVKVLGESRDRPFFLYLHFMEPHSPYHAPAGYDSLFVDPEYGGLITGRHRQLDKIVVGKLKVDDADVAQMEALYDQEIRYMDDEFGFLVDFLAEQGLGDNTLVVFIADHGEEFLEHGSALHGYTLYQEQLHVPFIIHDPSRPTGQRLDSVTRHVDVLPTLLEMLHINYDQSGQGQSLVPLLDGRDSGEEEVDVLAEVSLMAIKTVRQRSLTVGDWKLIEGIIPKETVELYDLRQDPGEQQNLAAIDSAKTEELRTRLADLLASLPAAKGTTTILSEKEIQKLRSLGYVR
ncbi:MAG: sulfatase [Candidatus Krumholzibacteriota bacterium]